MQIKDTSALRRLLAEKKEWYTVDAIAAGLGMSSNTISSALRGKKIRPHTVQQLAAAVEMPVMSIAEYVE